MASGVPHSDEGQKKHLLHPAQLERRIGVITRHRDVTTKLLTNLFVKQDAFAARMKSDELGDIEYFAVNDDPEIPRFFVLRQM